MGEYPPKAAAVPKRRLRMVECDTSARGEFVKAGVARNLGADELGLRIGRG